MPSTTCPIVSWTLLTSSPPTDQLARPAVAAVTRGAGGDEVADAGQAREGGEVGAEAHAEARHLGEAARHERRARVVAEAQAVGDADRDGDGVLGGAAELDADHVVVGVDAQRVAGDDALQASREALIGRGDDGRRRHVVRDLLGMIGTRQRRDGGGRLLGDDLGRPPQGVQLEALGQRELQRLAWPSRRDPAAT